jgi:ankyrin repeat protein
MVARGDCPEVIAALCKAGADVNARSRDQRTPLLMLLRRSKATAAAVEAMIKGGADVNAADKSGETPLLSAASSSDADVLSLLLRHGANVNAKGGRNERTALMELCQSRNASAAALDVLAKAGADVNAVDRSGDSALMQAVSSYRPNPEIIDWLIAHGANARAVNCRKLSIVEAARKNKRLANTEVLQRIEAAAR